MKKRETRSPFFNRAYGGFSRAQEEFFRDLVGNPRGKIVLDPMAGQAASLIPFAERGARLWIGDLNPAPLLLAFLRSPAVVANHEMYVAKLSEMLAALKRRRIRRGTINRFVPTWIAPEVANDLKEFASRLELGLFSSPFVAMSDFWLCDDFAKFATAIAVLAARDLACYRQTDNRTWLKPGGLLRDNNAIGPLSRALAAWAIFATRASREKPESEGGEFHIGLMNATMGDFGDIPKAHWIITSPPYANRLDYTRLWAPELNVLSSMCHTTYEKQKREQIGTIVVEDTAANDKDISLLPKKIRVALDRVKKDHAAYSESYYYPFFRNYAVALTKSLKYLPSLLRRQGMLAIVVRDTVRKDILFPTGELISAVLTSKDCGLEQVEGAQHVIRHHVGLLRKSSTQGLYGLAQQEWWLVFRKPHGGR